MLLTTDSLEDIYQMQGELTTLDFRLETDITIDNTFVKNTFALLPKDEYGVKLRRCVSQININAPQHVVRPSSPLVVSSQWYGNIRGATELHYPPIANEILKDPEVSFAIEKFRRFTHLPFGAVIDVHQLHRDRSDLKLAWPGRSDEVEVQYAAVWVVDKGHYGTADFMLIDRGGPVIDHLHIAPGSMFVYNKKKYTLISNEVQSDKLDLFQFNYPSLAKR